MLIIIYIVINDNGEMKMCHMLQIFVIKFWKCKHYLSDYSLRCLEVDAIKFWETTILSSSVVKHSLLVREVWGSIPGPVKSNTVQPTARHRCDVSSELCCSVAKKRRWHTLRYGASMIKICLLQEHYQEGGDRGIPPSSFWQRLNWRLLEIF